MSIPDNPYEPPLAEVVSPHATFSRDEWRTMAKVFGAWVVGASIFTGIGLTLQTAYALEAFSAQSRVGGIVVVSSLREISPIIVYLATSVAFTLTLDKRTQQNIPPPKNVAHGLAICVLVAGFLIANAMVTATSFLTAILSEGGSTDVFLESIRATVLPHDFVHGSVKCISTMLVGILALPRVAGWFARFQRGKVFKCFILVQGFGFVTYVLGRLLMTAEGYLG